MAFAHSRKRSYHDLTAEEKAKYDEIRARAKALGKEKKLDAARELHVEADAMLGLSFLDDYTGPERVKTKEHDPNARNAGTSRDMGHQ